VAAFQLKVELAAAILLRQPVRPDQGGIPLADGKQRGIGRNRQIVFVLKKDSSFQC